MFLKNQKCYFSFFFFRDVELLFFGSQILTAADSNYKKDHFSMLSFLELKIKAYLRRSGQRK